MRLSTRKALAQLGLFLAVLGLIIFLNRPPSSRKSFAWATVRYKTTASTLPVARGFCPGTVGNSKPTLVVARVAADGDPTWLYGLGSKYHLCIYYTDAPVDPESKNLQVPVNRGHEAMAYLTFLIDNYDDIGGPGVVFTHGSRYAWHNDHVQYDNAALLAALNIRKALEPYGYHNLRCDWSLSTCPASTPPQGSLTNSMQAAMARWDARAASDAALPRALQSLFGGHDWFKGNGQVALGRNDPLRSQCCAQFVVTPGAIKQHSRDEYVALRQWLLDGNIRGAPSDDRVAGRILSYVWHILFLPHEQTAKGAPKAPVNLARLNHMACPKASDCYCHLYDRCNLNCPSPEHCDSGYRLPPNLQIPEGWPNTET